MHVERKIGSELWEPLAAELDDVLLIELCMLIGHYEMLAMTLNTLEVQPERPPRL
jgi:alkylhydroperoxidase family enzyme